MRPNYKKYKCVVCGFIYDEEKGDPDSGIKAGTKVKGIRIIESDNGHNISCKIDGIGSMYLKSEFVRKA